MVPAATKAAPVTRARRCDVPKRTTARTLKWTREARPNWPPLLGKRQLSWDHRSLEGDHQRGAAPRTRDDPHWGRNVRGDVVKRDVRVNTKKFPHARVEVEDLCLDST